MRLSVFLYSTVQNYSINKMYFTSFVYDSSKFIKCILGIGEKTNQQMLRKPLMNCHGTQLILILMLRFDDLLFEIYYLLCHIVDYVS